MKDDLPIDPTTYSPIKKTRTLKSIQSVLFSIVIVSSILLASAALIAYGRGYRPGINGTSLKPTGLLSATSDPIGAQVYIDDTLRTATNNSFSIDPGWYSVTIRKEGYQPWNKKLRVQGEVVMRADAFLFPTTPSLSPLTVVGITKPVLSPDGTKIAYVIPTVKNDAQRNKKAGLWIYELGEGPLGRNRDPLHIGTDDGLIHFTDAVTIWSPDSAELLVQYGAVVRLYQVNRLDLYQDISATYQSVLADWQEEKATKDRQKLAAFKQPIINLATSSASILAFSPDETKILYEATASATIPTVMEQPLIGTNPTQEERTIQKGKIYVYDSKEDKNFFVLDIKELPLPPSPTPTPKGKTAIQPTTNNSQLSTPYLQWFPTSRHLLLNLGNKIDIMEYDRTNWITVYAGPFVPEFVAPWSNSSRIVIMSTLNPNPAGLPNLYTVNLR